MILYSRRSGKPHTHNILLEIHFLKEYPLLTLNICCIPFSLLINAFTFQNVQGLLFDKLYNLDKILTWTLIYLTPKSVPFLLAHFVCHYTLLEIQSNKN